MSGGWGRPVRLSQRQEQRFRAVRLVSERKLIWLVGSDNNDDDDEHVADDVMDDLKEVLNIFQPMNKRSSGVCYQLVLALPGDFGEVANCAPAALSPSRRHVLKTKSTKVVGFWLIFQSLSEDEALEAFRLFTRYEPFQRAECALCIAPSPELSRATTPAWLRNLTPVRKHKNYYPLFTTDLIERQAASDEVLAVVAGVHESSGKALGRLAGEGVVSAEDDAFLSALVRRDDEECLQLIQALDIRGETLIDSSPALCVATKLGSEVGVRTLLARTSSPLCEIRDGDFSSTALHIAAASNLTVICSHLIRFGDSTMLEARNAALQTPVLAAAAAGQGPAVLLLLRRGCNPNTTDASGSTLIHYCSRNGLVGPLTLLVRDCSASFICLKDMFGDEAIHKAAELGRADCIRVLLETGFVNVDEPSATGDTPLILATKANQFACAESLILAGANCDCKNAEGVAAVDIARASQLSRMLIDRKSQRVPVQPPQLRRQLANLLQHESSCDMTLELVMSDRVVRRRVHRFFLALHQTSALPLQSQLQVAGGPDLELVVEGVLELLYGVRPSVVASATSEDTIRYVCQTLNIDVSILRQRKTAELELKIPRSSVELLKDRASRFKHGHPDDVFDVANVSLRPTGDGENALPVHGALLAQQSEVFHAMLFGGMAESTSTSGVQVSLIDDSVPDGFMHRIWEYLYTEQIDLDSNAEDALPLLALSSKWEFVRLRQLCEDFLAMSISPENACGLLSFAEQHGAFQLRAICVNYAAQFWSSLQQNTEFLADFALLNSTSQDEVRSIATERAAAATRKAIEASATSGGFSLNLVPIRGTRRSGDHW